MCCMGSSFTQTMVLLIPTTTLIVFGVKFSDSLLPASKGMTTVTLPPPVAFEVVDEVVVVEVVVLEEVVTEVLVEVVVVEVAVREVVVVKLVVIEVIMEVVVELIETKLVVIMVVDAEVKPVVVVEGVASVVSPVSERLPAMRGE